MIRAAGIVKIMPERDSRFANADFLANVDFISPTL
jgi:hypothetical protein